MIPGDPAAIEATADDLDRLAAQFAELRDRLVAHAQRTCAEWSGLAARLALAQLLSQANRVSVGEQVCRGSAQAYREFAVQLRRAQREFAEAQARLEAAQAQLAALVASVAAVAILTESQANEQVAAARAAMEAARNRAASANDAAATRINHLVGELDGMVPPAASGGQGPPAAAAKKDDEAWWESTLDAVGHQLSEYYSGVWESSSGLVQSVWGVSFVTLATDPDRYVNNIRALARGAIAATKNPERFAKRAGDWETWQHSPARAVGHLVPDLLLGVLLGGAGAKALKSLRVARGFAPRKIKGFTGHGRQRVFENSRGDGGVNDRALRDAVKNPQKPPEFRPDDKGGTYFYRGKDANVTLNRNGEVVTGWAKNSKGRRFP